MGRLSCFVANALIKCGFDSVLLSFSLFAIPLANLRMNLIYLT